VQVAKYAKEILARKRPDIQIVGEDLHPLAQVRDFAPYIAKIKASGADSVITGNWGSDLSLLIKAANDAGYNGKFFTYYAGVTGTPTAMGARWRGQGLPGAYNHYNTGENAEVDGRVQEEVQRRLVHRRRVPRLSRCWVRDGQGQVHRSGQGGGWRWKA
jgi:branched-chain amino acid transport system substrate-binding protein